MSEPQTAGRFRTWHPAAAFALLTVVVVLLSWLLSVYGVVAIDPETGRYLSVRSLLSAEALRWWLREGVDSFLNLTPVGSAVLALLSMGVLRASGLTDVGVGLLGIGRNRVGQWVVVVLVVFAGLMLGTADVLGYVYLIPLAAWLFGAVGLSPVGGLLIGFLAVACGHGLNPFVSAGQIEAVRTALRVARLSGLPTTDIGLLGISRFTAFAFGITLVLLVAYGWWLGHRQSLAAPTTSSTATPRLSRKERRSLTGALVVAVAYTLLIWLAALSPWAIVRGIDGRIVGSSFERGAGLLMALGVALTGTTFGLMSGRFRSGHDVVAGMCRYAPAIALFLTTAFAASQLLACLQYARIDTCLTLLAAERFANCPYTGPLLWVSTVGVVAVINLLIPGSAMKWTLLSGVLIPMMCASGHDVLAVLCAYGVGDGVTDAMTPLLAYLPLMLTYGARYAPHLGLMFLTKRLWPGMLLVLIAQTALLLVWLSAGWPLGE